MRSRFIPGSREEDSIIGGHDERTNKKGSIIARFQKRGPPQPASAPRIFEVSGANTGCPGRDKIRVPLGWDVISYQSCIAYRGDFRSELKFNSL